MKKKQFIFMHDLIEIFSFIDDYIFITLIEGEENKFAH